jgi:anti-sigma regulatory factor (Ser/Thr protein kinase)
LSDALVLTFPNEPRFFALVRLVLSGLAAQLDLPYERVDDLQLAVEGALAAESPPGGEVTLRIEPRKEALSVWMSPLGGQSISSDQPERTLGFQQIAAELVDAVEIVMVEGKNWLRLEKRIPANVGGS